MLDKHTILNTVTVRYDQEGECYVAEHDVWEGNIGCGDTEAEAKQVFAELLDDAWPYFAAGNHAMNRKVGRPALGRVKVTTKLKPEYRDRLKTEASSLKISVGELIERMTIRFLG
jgi:hypothetical protein